MKRFTTRRRALAVMLLLAILAWWLWPNRQLVHVHDLQRELASESLTPEERQEKFQQLRTEMAKLSPEQRAQLGAERQQRTQEQMARYFAMTPDEKKQYLDQQIDRMEDAMRRMSNGGVPAGPPPGGSPAGASSKSPEDRERRRQQRLDATTPEFRAQMDQYRKDMAQRRQQRGLPPTTGFPGRGR